MVDFVVWKQSQARGASCVAFDDGIKDSSSSRLKIQTHRANVNAHIGISSSRSSHKNEVHD